MAPDLFSRLLRIYDGSDAEATKGLYRELIELGPAGELAMNLFRAQKASARAKVYRGGIRGQGSYASLAYERKAWAVSQAVQVLERHAAALQVRWGWQHDTAQPVHRCVLYVDLPTGQVSFHLAARGTGPQYDIGWDGVVNASPGRILRWCVQVLAGEAVPA